ncbi:TPA: hypothetical protein DD394_01795 [bacterium UBP9_UBA11836]|nr:hypothetical protein [bacterium UBP9_UBA11836]
MNRRFLVFVSVSFLIILLVSGFLILNGQRLRAQPQHIRGSANVAVSGYGNSCGNFILWSNGRITSSEGKVVNEADQYTLDSTIKMPTRVKGQCVGASQVAVSVFVNGSGSYVVFADGSVRRPRNSKAAAGNSDLNIVAGNIFKEPAGNMFANTVPQFNSGFTRTYVQNGLYKNVRIDFDKPFTKSPVVLLHTLHMANPAKETSVQLRLKYVTNTHFIIEYNESTSYGGVRQLGDKCFFIALGE